jgi:hypothetical protein
MMVDLVAAEPKAPANPGQRGKIRKADRYTYLAG